MKLLNIVVLVLLVAVSAQDDSQEGTWGKKKMFMKKSMMMKKMKGSSLTDFRIDSDSDEGADNKKKKMAPSMTGFRVAGEDTEECPVEMFQIVSGLFGKMCIDGTNKRLGLKPCESEPSAHQLFSVHRTNGQFLLKNKGQCVSGSSLTKGPCETNMVGLSRSGAFHMIKMSGEKCFNARNKNSVNMVKCANKNKKQHFRFVPVFDAMDSASDSMSGFRIASEEEFSKKGKKKGNTEDELGGNFRISSDDDLEEGKEKKWGGKK